MAIIRKGYVRFSPDIARQVLTHLARTGSLRRSAKLVGVTDIACLSWVRDSSMAEDRNDLTSKFYFAGWPPDTDDAEERFAYFHRNYDLARKMYQMTLSQEAASMALSGYEEPVVVDGRQCWIEDSDLLAEFGGNREAAVAAGHKDAFFKHDEFGGRLPLMRRVMPSSQFLIAALRALSPNPWNVPDKRIVDQTVTGTMQVYTPPPQNQPPRLQGPNQAAAPRTLEAALAARRAGLPVLTPVKDAKGHDPDPDADLDDQRPHAERFEPPPRPPQKPPNDQARPNRGEQVGYGRPLPGGYKAV